jgi:hypothetical protein
MMSMSPYRARQEAAAVLDKMRLGTVYAVVMSSSGFPQVHPLSSRAWQRKQNCVRTRKHLVGFYTAEVPLADLAADFQAVPR